MYKYEAKSDECKNLVGANFSRNTFRMNDFATMQMAVLHLVNHSVIEKLFACNSSIQSYQINKYL